MTMPMAMMVVPRVSHRMWKASMWRAEEAWTTSTWRMEAVSSVEEEVVAMVQGEGSADTTLPFPIAAAQNVSTALEYWTFGGTTET